jgi:hypothetical protein
VFLEGAAGLTGEVCDVVLENVARGKWRHHRFVPDAAVVATTNGVQVGWVSRGVAYSVCCHCIMMRWDLIHYDASCVLGEAGAVMVDVYGVFGLKRSGWL